MMKQIILFFSLLTWVFNASAQEDSTIPSLYKVADLVMHIRLASTQISETPYFSHDMGTDWYTFQFTILGIYKQRTVSADSSFSLVHYYGEPPIANFLNPGKEYIVFLKTVRQVDGNTFQNYSFPGTPVLIKGGLIPYTKTLDRWLKKLPEKTSFDRAVNSSRWKAVERKIHRRVRKEAFSHGRNTTKTLEHLNAWIRSHQSVDDVQGDSCAIHIAIYPGWVDEGIRFLTASGPHEFQVTIGLGKIRRWCYICRWTGLHSSCDKVIFRGFMESYGLLAAYRKTCLQYRFQRVSNWQNQQDIEITTSHPYDTIQPVAMTSPLIRVKIKMVNRSAGPLNVLWPEGQDDGHEIFLFSMLEREGEFRKEDGEFLEMPPMTSIGPSMVRLVPGDSVVGWHSFNDPFCSDTDPTACHDLSFLPEGDWKIGMYYKPSVTEGDTSVYWNPEGGTRMVWNDKPIHINSVTPVSELTFKARLLEITGNYRNFYGQKGRYDALVTAVEVPVGSPFNQGDTLACRFPVNVHYLMNLAAPRPAMDAELMKPGDYMEIDLLANYPPDEFRLPSGRVAKNYLLLNSPGALRIIRE